MNTKAFKQKYIVKLSQRVKMILKDFFYISKYYSFLYACYNALWWISWYLSLNKICMWSFKKKEEVYLLIF